MNVGFGKEQLEKTTQNLRHTSLLLSIPRKPNQQLELPSGLVEDIPVNIVFLIKKPVNPFVVTQLTLQSKS